MSGRFLVSYRALKSLSAGKTRRSHRPTEAACGEYKYIYEIFAKFMLKSTPDEVAVADTPGTCGGTIKGIDRKLSQKSNLSFIDPQNQPIFISGAADGDVPCVQPTGRTAKPGAFARGGVILASSALRFATLTRPAGRRRIDPRRATSRRLLSGKASPVAAAGKRRWSCSGTMGAVLETVEDGLVRRRRSERRASGPFCRGEKTGSAAQGENDWRLRTSGVASASA